MPFVSFHDYFPEIAEREIRRIVVFPESDVGLPTGEYGFVEMYCDEPGCDCRRVMFSIMSSRRKALEAVVAWGWENPEFYAKWLKYGDASAVRDLKGPVLNLGSPQTELAPALLKLARDVLLQDANYIERIKRHYAMFRKKIDEKVAGFPSRVTSQQATGAASTASTCDAAETFEDRYVDALENIEFAIVATFKRHPEMTDYAVMRILEALIDDYNGERIGRAPRGIALSAVEEELMNSSRTMCEWRLGRATLASETAQQIPGPEPKTVEEIILCLRRILKSVKRWNKTGGRQGYLEFIVQHVQ